MWHGIQLKCIGSCGVISKSLATYLQLFPSFSYHASMSSSSCASLFVGANFFVHWLSGIFYWPLLLYICKRSFHRSNIRETRWQRNECECVKQGSQVSSSGSANGGTHPYSKRFQIRNLTRLTDGHSWNC